MDTAWTRTGCLDMDILTINTQSGYGQTVCKRKDGPLVCQAFRGMLQLTRRRLQEAASCFVTKVSARFMRRSDVTRRQAESFRLNSR